MQTVGVYEAKTKFSAILNDAGDVEAAIAEIMELRKNFAGAFDGEDIKALIEEGRM